MKLYVPYGTKEEYLKAIDKNFPQDWKDAFERGAIEVEEMPEVRKPTLWERILLKLKKWI